MLTCVFGCQVIAYAMKEFDWSLERAMQEVKKKRNVIRPNPGFMQQLITYQGILDARSVRVETEVHQTDDRGNLRPPPPESDALWCPCHDVAISSCFKTAI